MAFKIVATVIYGSLALILAAGVAYNMYRGENDLKTALWLLVFMLGVAALWA